MKQKTIVVTGGAGYIGSYVVHNLLTENFEVVVIDDLSNSDQKNINPRAKFFHGDFIDSEIWKDIVKDCEVEGVIHLAAYIEVEESFQKPEQYFLNNAEKTKQLLSILDQYQINNFVFASTCGVYGASKDNPLTEQTSLQPINPYAESKAKAEEYISSAVKDQNLNSIIFRFFNTAGALLEVKVRPKNQSALLSQIRIAVKEDKELKVFGNQYPTKDGTCIRDFVHVYDVARACVEGMKSLLNKQKQFEMYNIGSECGFSVLEIIHQTEQIFDKKLNVKVTEPRKDEVVVSVASSQKLKNELNFEFQYSDLENILKTGLA